MESVDINGIHLQELYDFIHILLEENTKLKNVIEILKDKFKFELGVSVVKEKYYYSLEFLYTNEYFTISQEQYELLKEVLENEK